MGIPKIGTFFCYNFKSIANLKLKFWGYDKKNESFYLTLLPADPWGMRMYYLGTFSSTGDRLDVVSNLRGVSTLNF